MVSCQLLYWINARLKQIMQNKKTFGNISLIICGDWGQIPPIGQNSLYSKMIKDDIGDEGKNL